MNKNTKDGPESVPLRSYVKSFKMMVIVYNLSTEKVEREVEIDYGIETDRKWLGRLSYWAATEGRSVETLSFDDWTKFYK
jgi:hypothetical protein